MALIICPECGGSVSDKAEKCPKCAYPLHQVESPKINPNNLKTEVVVKPKEGCFLQTLNIGCMIVAVIIGLIFLSILIGLFNK